MSTCIFVEKQEQLLLLKETAYLGLLTHLCRVDSSTTTPLAGLFPVAECLVIFYYNDSLKKFLLITQTV